MLAQIDFNRLYSELNSKGLTNPGRITFSEDLTLGQIIAGFMPYLFASAGVLLLLYLIYGGFSFMMSRGEPKQAQEARAKITNALIGFIIIFLAYLLVQLVGRIFNIPIIINIFS